MVVPPLPVRPFVVMPDGVRINIATVESYSVSGSNLVIKYMNGIDTYTFSAGSNANALSLMKTLDLSIQSNMNLWVVREAAS